MWSCSNTSSVADRNVRAARSGLRGGRRWGGWAKTGGVEGQGFDFAFGALRGQLLSIEFKIDGTDISGFDDDLSGGVYGFFSEGTEAAALQNFVSVRSDGEPGVGVQGDAQHQRSWDGGRKGGLAG